MENFATINNSFSKSVKQKWPNQFQKIGKMYNFLTSWKSDIFPKFFTQFVWDVFNDENGGKTWKNKMLCKHYFVSYCLKVLFTKHY